MATQVQNKSMLLIWDLLVRVFHWSLAIFFVLAYFFESDGLRLHSHAGYTLALLVLFRLLWGVIGSKYARFTNFVVSPKKSLQYLVSFWRKKQQYFLGHNPAGAAMIIMLLSSLLATSFSGIALFAVQGSGPLANTFVSSWPGGILSATHDLAADISLALVVLHIIGAMVTSFYYRENLVKAMITGKKKNVALDSGDES